MSEATTNQVKIVDFSRLSLYTSTPGVEGKRSRMSFGARDGNPRITVFTNDPRDTIAKGVISAAMNPETFMVFVNRFKNIVRSTTEVKDRIDCYGSRWENNKKVEDRVLLSTIWFGRDAEGIIWISVVADGRPKIRFDFRMSDWHHVYVDGKQIDEATASAFEAGSKIHLIESAMTEQILKNLGHKTIRGQQPQEDQQQTFTKPESSTDAQTSQPAENSSGFDVFHF